MLKSPKCLIGGCAVAALLIGANPAWSQGVQILFGVDESGSLAPQHDFLDSFVPSLDQSLAGAGVSSRQYGLIGYGSASVAPREIPVGGMQFGTAQEFVDAAQNLLTNGGTEDGYAAIQFGVDNYTFASSSGTKRVYVLVTDEDRDNTDPNLTFQSIQAALTDNDITLAGIVNQQMQDPNGVNGVGANESQTFVDADNDGEFEVSGPPTFTTAGGNTFADYTELIFTFADGCVGDSEVIRNGGTPAEAFAGALSACLIEIVVDLGINPFVALASRDTTLAFSQSFSSQVGLRMTGLVQAGDAPTYALADDAAGMAEASRVSPMLQYAAAMANPTDLAASQAAAAPISGMTEFNLGGPLRGFASVQGTINDYEYGSFTGGAYNSYTVSGVVGLDYELAPNTLVGFAGGVGGGWANEDGTSSEVDSFSWSLGVYGTVPFAQHGYVDGIVSYTNANLDTTRDTGGGSQATADGVDGMAVSAQVEAGYAYKVEDIATVVPALGFAYTYLDVDSFTESGPGAVSFGDQNYNLFTFMPKISVHKTYDLGSVLVTPIASIGGELNFGDRSDTITATALSGGSTLGTFDLPDIYRGAGTAQLGVAANWRGLVTARLDWAGTFSGVQQSNAITGRIRIPF